MVRRLRRAEFRERILQYVRKHPEGVNRSVVEREFNTTYWVARYNLDVLVLEGKIRVKSRFIDKRRRVDYFPIVRYARLKIRIYNEMFAKPPKEYPEGYFQGFFEVDGILTELGLPDLTWSEMLRQIDVCKLEMWIEFNKPMAVHPIKQMTFQYTPGMKAVELSGIPPDERKMKPSFEIRGARYIRPRYFRAEPPMTDEEKEKMVREYEGVFTVEELIWGISNKLPRLVDMPEFRIIKERLIVIKKGEINWDSGSIEREIV